MFLASAYVLHATQDGEEYDSIQLLSVNDAIEIYYQKLRDAMDTAASEAKNKNGFDGNLLEQDAKNLAEFCNLHQVPAVSQALAELLTCMEIHNEKKTSEIKDTAIYNALLRLEKAIQCTSTWELYGAEDYDGPILDFTNFEVNMIEQQMSLYVADILSKNHSQTLFFPLADFYESDAIIKWRILEKLDTIKLFAHETIYKRKLKLHLKERLKEEINTWLKKETEKLKLTGMTTVFKDADALSKIMKDLRTQVTMAIDIAMSETLFQEVKCSYFEILAETVDDVLFPLCERLMEMMDLYQTRHKDFHVNMRDSCAISHRLYLECKRILDLLTTPGKIGRHLKLHDYASIFSKFFVNLLQVMKLECHNRIKRAVQAQNKDSAPCEEKIPSSSVIVLTCMCTVIDEWKHMEIEDEEQKIAFLVKITDIICDGAKIFAESVEHRLEVNFPLKDLEALKKVCVLANSIEHVLQYLQDLPQRMQWSEVLESIKNDSSENCLKEQVLRILQLLHQSMNTHMSEIITKLLNFSANSVLNNVEKQFLAWLISQSTNQMFDRFVAHLNEELEFMDATLKENLFSQFLSHLWTLLLTNIEKNFQEGSSPEYAKTVEENVQYLKEYLLNINMKELEVHKPLMQQLKDLLELNSKTTEELQLDYYVQIAESIVSPVEYLGHIAFQAGYKTVDSDTVDLYINVQKGQRLPARKFEMSHLIVKVELCPSTLFPSQVPFKSAPVTEDLDNPVFNEFFQFSKLPSSVLDVKGAVVQVLVFNQDYSYSAEAILLLNLVQNMSGVVSLEFLPVYLMPLRKFDMSHISYQVLENRIRWDKHAKSFINKRAKLSKGQKKLLPCIPGKGLMCGFSRND